uniref:Uncharacterized protein n=1 Tax=Trypanosoma vivax (strain Y486) TaxID=1055687 RepID=G0U2C2_TRYVY|nr:hypothetical protein TVY486_0902470 [Trypanosoma vivax Y486]
MGWCSTLSTGLHLNMSFYFTTGGSSTTATRPFRSLARDRGSLVPFVLTPRNSFLLLYSAPFLLLLSVFDFSYVQCSLRGETLADIVLSMGRAANHTLWAPSFYLIIFILTGPLLPRRLFLLVISL